MALDFHIVVLIFISCMIALALLIYYCQEKINPKYDFKDKQRSISAIALSIAAPGFAMQESKTQRSYPPVILRHPPQRPPPPGFHYPPTMHEEDEISDSGSSTSSKIYFSAKSTAYSVAKRMSETPKYKAAVLAKRMSETPYPKSFINSSNETPLANPLVLQKRTSETPYPHNFHRPSSALASQFIHKKMSLDPRYSSNIPWSSQTEKTACPSPGSHAFTVHKVTIPPVLPETLNEGKNRRSTSPFIPTSVVTFTKRSNSRSKSPTYSARRGESPYTQLKSDESPTPFKKRSLSPVTPIQSRENSSSSAHSDSPSPPKLENIRVPERLNLAFCDYNNSPITPLTPVEEE